MEIATDYIRMLTGDTRTTNLKWPMWKEESQILVTPDGCRWRIESTPTVGNLVHIGDTVRTNYRTGGLVISVTPHPTCCCPYDKLSDKVCRPNSMRHEILDYHRVLVHWSIIYVGKDAKIDRQGKFWSQSDYCYINELVAAGNRVLHLFENNHDEVFIDKPINFAKPVQLNLF